MADFATLARQISSWTTKCLLTLLILVAGLGFGRQVLRWWAADRSPSKGAAVVSPGDGLGDPLQLHTIQFGDAPWSLRRQSIAGDKQQAIERLRAACRDMLLDTKPRPEDTALSGEEKFLAFLSDSTPVDQRAGEWRLYELHEAFPMAVGVARCAAAAGGRPTEVEADLVRSGYRVVIWGIAVPIGSEQWTLCTLQPGVRSSLAAPALAEIPLPPEGRRCLSLRSAEGGGFVAFRAADRPQECKRFYDDWFRSQAWQPTAGWQLLGTAWCAKFAAPDGSGSVDVRFGPDGRGGLSGLLAITPSEAR